MKELLFFAVILIFAYCLLSEFRRTHKRDAENDVPPQGEDLPYRSKYILSNNEYRFYTALKPLMDSKAYLICPKVGLKDIFDVTAKGRDRAKYWAHISQKHVDFLICDDKLHPLFAIELDDKSHQKADAKERDAFKNALFASAKLPLYRIPSSASYTEEFLTFYLHLN